MKKFIVFLLVLTITTLSARVLVADTEEISSSIQNTESSESQKESFWDKYKTWIISGTVIAVTAGATWYLLDKEQSKDKDDNDTDEKVDMEKLRKEVEQKIAQQQQQQVKHQQPEKVQDSIESVEEKEVVEPKIQDKVEIEKTKDNIKYFNATLWKDIQVYDKTYSVKGVRFNVSFGENENVTGLDFGFPVPMNYVNGNMKGIQLGIYNKIRGNVKGLQAGIYNKIAGNFTGWQFGGINIVENDFLGLQTGIYNQSHSITGLQFGFYNSTQRLNGAQIGILNFNYSGNKWFKYPLFMCPLVNVAF